MSEHFSTKRSRAATGADTSPGHLSGEPEIGSDHIAYIADMIAELQQIARRGGLETLATILGLAEVEASRQAAQTRQSTR